jgi:hypothetical protein
MAFSRCPQTFTDKDRAMLGLSGQTGTTSDRPADPVPAMQLAATSTTAPLGLAYDGRLDHLHRRQHMRQEPDHSTHID